MTDPHPPASPAQKRERRLWLTIGELVGLLALVIAGLNYWDFHRDRTSAERQAVTAARAHAALVMTGQVQDEGARLTLAPLNPTQAVQSQRYAFPGEVLDHPMEVVAARPQIDLRWIAGGLKTALAKGHAPSRGEAELPVGVTTTYVEDGETLTDQSIYQVGYAFRERLLLGPKFTLEGLSLARRHVRGDLQAQVNALWRARPRPAPLAD